MERTIDTQYLVIYQPKFIKNKAIGRFKKTHTSILEDVRINKKKLENQFDSTYILKNYVFFSFLKA